MKYSPAHLYVVYRSLKKKLFFLPMPPHVHIHYVVPLLVSSFGGLVVSMLVSGTQGCRFKPGWSRWIFQVIKIFSIPSFRGEVKPLVVCRSFAVCKKPLQFPWKSHCRLNLIGHFWLIIPPFADRGLSRRLTWSTSGDDGKLKAVHKGPVP
jgi:hypothetical protein